MSIYDDEHKTLFKNLIKKDVLKSMSDKDLIGNLFENFCINDEKGSVIVQS